jgi:hypothetical protein
MIVFIGRSVKIPPDAPAGLAAVVTGKEIFDATVVGGCLLVDVSAARVGAAGKCWGSVNI